MPKMNTIGWFDIYVTDLPRAAAFYETVFDCRLEDIGDPTGETQMRAFPTDMSLYGAGGQVLRPKFSIGEFGFVSLCQDTEGNIFGLSSMA